MRVLLDESIPRRLRDHLRDHQVTTVRERGWGGLDDGPLLAAAAPFFDALITADQKLPYQQNLASFDLGVLILVAKTNRLVDYVPLLPRIQQALEGIEAGQAVRVSSPIGSRR